MKSIFNIRVIVILLFLFSCKKPDLPPPSPPSTTNRPPVANAGPDIITYLPDEESVVLDGSKSEAVGTKLTGSWRKLAGDTVLSGYKYQVYQEIIFIYPGKYAFELTVTDVAGAMARDTMNVTVAVTSGCVFNQPIMEASFIEVTSHTDNSNIYPYIYNRTFISSNGKVFLGGGMGWDDNDIALFSGSIWMFDLDTKVWKNFNMSLKRGMSTAAANGRLVLFAGGMGEGGVTSQVDIFDPLTEKLAVARLSVARTDISAASIGSTFIFAGGMEINDKYSDVVDIYDTLTKSWSVTKLSEPRRGISAVVSGTRVYFSGGEGINGRPSSRIDIYDQSTGQWSVSKMNIPRFGVQAAVVGDLIVFWGGYYFDANVDLYKVNKAELFNTRSQSSSVQCTAAASWIYSYFAGNERIATVGNSKCYYASDFLLTRYDVANNSFSRAFLPHPIDAMFTYKNELYMLGYRNPEFKIHKVTL